MINKQKILRTTYRAANLLLPLWEGKSVLKAGRYALEKRAESAAKLRLLREEESPRVLTFEEAIRQSGLSCPVLIKRYLLRKRAWLGLTGITVLMMVALVFSVATTDIPVSGLTRWRPFSLLFMLTGFAAMVFMQAMACQFRLWQLVKGELAEFTVWRQTRHSLKETLSWNSGTTPGNNEQTSET